MGALFDRSGYESVQGLLGQNSIRKGNLYGQSDLLGQTEELNLERFPLTKPNPPETLSQDWVRYSDPSVFRDQFGVPSVHSKSDLSGSSRKFWGVPDDYLDRALAQYNKTGTFYGANNVPLNLEAGLDWITKNYGSTVPELSNATLIDENSKFGTPGQYRTLISKKNAGDTWAIWDKNPDGTYTNSGIGYYDSQKDHDNALGTILPLALSFIPGFQGLGTLIGDALIGSSFLSPVVGNSILGGLTSAATGGNPLLGALSGGAGSFLSGSNLAGDMGAFAPDLMSGATQAAGGFGDLTGGALLDAGVTAGAQSSLGSTTLADLAMQAYEQAAANGFNGFGAEMISQAPNVAGNAAGDLTSLEAQQMPTPTDADVAQWMDSPSGGGGSMVDWWKQAISPSSNYGITDLLRAAAPTIGTVGDIAKAGAGLLGDVQKLQQGSGLLSGGGGGYQRANAPYQTDPLRFEKPQFVKIF